MKLNGSSQRSQSQSGLIAEVPQSSRCNQKGAATSKAAKSGFIHSGFALLLVAVASLIVASLLTACESLTVDFVYVATSKAASPTTCATNPSCEYGEINVFEINSESGKMRQIPTSPFLSGGRNPVAEAVSADDQNLFVVNQDDNTIVQFVIGTDGKLYPFYTVNTPGIFPLAVTVNKSNLFVVDTYEPLPLCSTAHPCPGSVSVFPLSGSTSSCTATTCLGSPAVNTAVSGNYWPLALSGTSANDVIVPTGVNVLASGSYVYVTAYDSSTPSPVGYVFGFSVGSGGVLAPLGGSPYRAGVQPSAIASDPTSSYIYVTDFVSGDVLAYTVASGNLIPMAGSPFPAGNQPAAIVVDPSFSFAYVANSGDGTIEAYAITNGKLGSLGNSGGRTTYSTGLQPIALGIDPSTNRYLFTVNFLDNTINNFQMNTTNGTLLNAQFSPYATSAQPMAVAAIPHNGVGGGIQQ